MAEVRVHNITRTARLLRETAARYSPREFGQRIMLAFDAANRKQTPIITGRLQRSFTQRSFPGQRGVRVRMSWRTPYAAAVEARRMFTDKVVAEGVRLLSRIQAGELRRR